ncbi:cytidylyltransferase domain-containing protein [Leptospira jelokensis]|uniref:acylneuraminate cytidylyltransferase family protein n=1 Tax=Leptospira jelokensis TaxID=2484931 RepID=UPI001090B3F4|nr:acylneuraminate cytidylyltransferase family protein [Leptospira jelokensis]TGL99210.1 acylneuraminate cytidylyltransferase family protein [Leptospira jelokensis]
MKILAVIPARAGSKRLPGKNIKLLGGKPLIQWSIDITKGIGEIIDCLVSTDSEEIANLSKSMGAFVPWLRPEELSSDTSLSIDVLLHAVEWYQKHKGSVDGILLLQPTSPFRNLKSLKEAIQKFVDHKAQNTVVSFSKLDYHPYWTFRTEGQFMKPFFSEEQLKVRSQDLPLAFRVNGSIYLIPTDWLLETKSIYTNQILPIFSEPLGEDIDIDTNEDWLDAERYLSQETQTKF